MLEIDANTSNRRVKDNGQQPEDEVWVRMGMGMEMVIGTGTLVFGKDPSRATSPPVLSKLVWHFPGYSDRIEAALEGSSIQEMDLHPLKRAALYEAAQQISMYRRTMIASLLAE